MAKALTDDEVLSICQLEIESAAGYEHGELAQERADALDRYYGEPDGNEVEGRSSIVTREVAETVEWILPSLLRIFTDSDNMVEFTPVGPEDVEQAKHETELVNHVYWKENRGFYNTYTFCKDALLSKNGILKVYWDETRAEEREEYEGLNPMEFGELLMDESVEREVIEYEEIPVSGDNFVEMPQYEINVVFKTKAEGKCTIDVVPPEECGVARDARSPYVDDQDFFYHRSRKSISDLIEMGVPEEKALELPSNDDVETQERLARRNKSDETDGQDWTNHESMRKVWVTECYIRIDRDGDGIAEPLKVLIASGSTSGGGGTLIDIEEIDGFCFANASPILNTHKFHGMSIDDLVGDLQEIKTTLTRQMLDNLYLANNGRTIANDKHINLDDLLTSRPGGIVRAKGDQPVNHYLSPIPHNPLPPEAFQMLDYLDEVRKQRTGSGDEVAALDKNTLANVNTGVMAMQYDAARSKIELIARIIAEVGFKTLFHKIHETLMKHEASARTVQVAGQFIRINPSEWRERKNSTVMVGMGSVSRERRMMFTEGVLQKQMEEAQTGGGGITFTPQHRANALKDWVDAWGFEASEYFVPPDQIQLPPPQPDAQGEALKMQAQAMMVEAQTKKERNMLDAAKMRAEAEIAKEKNMLQVREQNLKGEMEMLKQQIAAMKNNADASAKVASMEVQLDKQNAEKRLERVQMQLDEVHRQKEHQLELYKTQVDTITKLMPQQQKEGEKTEKMPAWVNQLVKQNQELSERVNQMSERQNVPRKVIRDKDGLIMQIGDQKITRDLEGRIEQIG